MEGYDGILSPGLLKLKQVAHSVENYIRTEAAQRALTGRQVLLGRTLSCVRSPLDWTGTAGKCRHPETDAPHPKLRGGLSLGPPVRQSFSVSPCGSSHRLPVVAVPKKYQPLPPEPESSWCPFPQRHTFPEAQRGPR